jgi:predicted small integral membrane protein
MSKHYPNIILVLTCLAAGVAINNVADYNHNTTLLEMFIDVSMFITPFIIITSRMIKHYELSEKDSDKARKLIYRKKDTNSIRF